eukprot:s1089_g19.t1
MFHITFWCFMFKEFCFVLYAKNMSVCFVIEVVIGWNQGSSQRTAPASPASAPASPHHGAHAFTANHGLKSTQDQQALDGAVSKTPPPCSCARTPASEWPTYQIRPNPRRGIQPEGDGGENGNFTLSMAYDVYSKAEATDALLAPKASETGSRRRSDPFDSS